MLKTALQKYQTVIEKNTFYIFNEPFEQKYEGYLNSIRDILLLLKSEVEQKGATKELFVKLLEEHGDNGLTALMALTGVSSESFKRIITLIRVVNNEKLSKLVNKDKWQQDEKTESEIKEWKDTKISQLISTNASFRAGVVNLFFEGATVPFLVETLPLFELKKYGIVKLQFDFPSLLDTLVRYKEKGSYAGHAENNSEIYIARLLKKLDLTFEKGDLRKLIDNENLKKRTMDFIIPNKKNPKIIIESSFLVTTSSGQGDKSKTEIGIRNLLKEHYPQVKFIGFVDGIGWYVRTRDLHRMVEAYDDVFTYHETELSRFEKFLKDEFDIK